MAVARAKRIAECDNIETAAIAAGAYHLAGGYCDGWRWEGHGQMFKVHR